MLTTVRRGARKAIDGFSRESEIGWRWGRNASPTLRYRREGGDAQLTPAGRDAVARLRRDGVAVTSMHDLLGSDELMDAVMRRVEGLIEANSEELASRARRLGERDGSFDKPYLLEMLGPMPTVRSDDPLARLVAHPRVRGVAEAYSGMRLRVYDYNAWFNIASDGEATLSQKWHRDLPEDHDIVKVFVYVRDVPEGAGPLSYVVGSHTKQGRRVNLPATWDGVGYRISDEDVESAYGADSIASVPGKAGTVVFADTRGLHRGGWARTHDRVVVQGLYASRSCNRPGSLVAHPDEQRDALSRDYAVLSPPIAELRANALGVDLTDLSAVDLDHRTT